MRAAAAALLGIEAAGVARAQWFAAAVALSGALVGLFLVVATRESAVIGFTGLGRVLGGVVQASLLFLPLLSVLATAQAVTSARESGSLEWYLSHPVSREQVFWGMFAPRYAAVAGPAVAAALLLAVAAAAMGTPVPLSLLGQFVALLAGQALCFAAAGMGMGAVSRAADRALLGALVLWTACAALVDFVLLGALLRWDLPPAAVFALAVINPIQAGRVGMLAGLDPELSVLGPVGTWAVVTLGAPATLAYGLAWPFLLGTALLLAARRAFLARDAL